MNKVPLKKLLINFVQAENVCPQAVEYTQTHVQETRHTVYHETNQKWNTQNLKPLFLQNLWTNISRHTAINKKLKIQTTKRKRVCWKSARRVPDVSKDAHNSSIFGFQKQFCVQGKHFQASTGFCRRFPKPVLCKIMRHTVNKPPQYNVKNMMILINMWTPSHIQNQRFVVVPISEKCLSMFLVHHEVGIEFDRCVVWCWSLPKWSRKFQNCVSETFPWVKSASTRYWFTCACCTLSWHVSDN
jgi:hypothetical protein